MGVFVVETVVWPSSPGRLNKTRTIDLECLKTKHIKKDTGIKSELYIILDSRYKDWLYMGTDGSNNAPT